MSSRKSDQRSSFYVVCGTWRRYAQIMMKFTVPHLALLRPQLLAAAVVVTTALTACQTEEKKPGIDVAALLKAAPEGAYVEGTVEGLGEKEVLNDKDFIYAITFDDDGDELAWVHHVTTHMEVSSAELASDAPRFSGKQKFQVQGNVSEFDIEDILYTKAEPGVDAMLVFPSRQGVLRQISAKDGSLVRALTTGVPLVRVALNPSRTLLAAAAVDGQVTLFDPKDLSVRGEARLHTDEIHGMVFTDDTHLITGGFDKELVLTEIRNEAPKQVALMSSALQTGERVFMAHLDGTKAIPVVRDSRQPHIIITSTAVKRLQLKPVAGVELPVRTALGVRTAPVVSLGELRISTLTFGEMKAAVCDVCVPVGAELLLGQNALSKAVFLDDVANDRVLVQPGKTVDVTLQPQTPPTSAATPAEATAAPADTAKPADDVATVAGAPEAAGTKDADPQPAADGFDDGETPDVVTKQAQDGLARFMDATLILVSKKRRTAPGHITDLDIDHSRQRVLMTYSHARAERNPDIYEAEKEDELPPPSAASAGMLVEPKTLEFGKRFVGQQGFTVAGAISPDGRTVVTGGWDKRTLVFDVETGALVQDEPMSWLVRRIRFSPDGQTLAVATWTPANPFDDNKSEPALLLYPVRYKSAEAKGTAAP